MGLQLTSERWCRPFMARVSVPGAEALLQPTRTDPRDRGVGRHFHPTVRRHLDHRARRMGERVRSVPERSGTFRNVCVATVTVPWTNERPHTADGNNSEKNIINL